MGRMYETQTSGVTLDEDRDLWEVLAATGKPILIHAVGIAQISDNGDANEEQARLEFVRGVGSVTSGSGGSSPTVHPKDDNDAASGGTIEANNTTRMAAGSGTLETLAANPPAWNIRQPLVHWWTPETRPRVNPGDRWTMAVLAAALADAVTANTFLVWEEI